MKFTIEQFTRTFTFGDTLHLCNLAEPIPILLMRLCDLREVGGAGLSSHICLPSVLSPPPTSSQAQGGTCSSQNTAPSSTSIPSGPADVTCCLLSTRPAKNHSSIVCELSLWHIATVAAKFILNNTVLL